VFTGLVKDLGRVTAIEQTGDGVTLAVRTRLSGDIALGDSVAVNGVCLTATAVENGAFEAEVMHETLRRSSLAEVGEGSDVPGFLVAARGRLGGMGAARGEHGGDQRVGPAQDLVQPGVRAAQ